MARVGTIGTKHSVALALGALLGAAMFVQACGSFTADAPAASDGGVGVGDASGETGNADGAEAAAGGFCAMHLDPAPALCSDFDETNALMGWREEVIGASSKLLADTVRFRSPPRALHAVLDGSSNATARLRLAIPPSAKRVRMSFVVQPAALALQDMQQISIAEIYCGDPSVSEGAFVFIEAASVLNVYTGDGAGTRTRLPNLAADGWTPVVLDARFDVGAPTVIVSVDGAASSPLPLAAACARAPVFEVRLGPGTYTSAMGEAFFDDVLFEVDPVGP